MPFSTAETSGARVAGLVALGGALGALARWVLETLSPWGGEVWVILAVNVLGSAALGFVLARPRAWWVPPLVGTGMLGGFTTYSTYAVQGLGLISAGDGAVGLALLVLTPVLCVGAAGLGLRCGRRRT